MAGSGGLWAGLEVGDAIWLGRRRRWGQAQWSKGGNVLFVNATGRVGELSCSESTPEGWDSVGKAKEEQWMCVGERGSRIKFVKDVVPGVGVKKLGRKVKRSIAVGFSRNGNFVCTVLENLRVVLWERDTGEQFLLTPPLAGGRDGSLLDIKVSVADDGRSVALHVCPRGNERFRRKTSPPVWIFVREEEQTCSSQKSQTADILLHEPSSKPGRLLGSWAMLGTDWFAPQSPEHVLFNLLDFTCFEEASLTRGWNISHVSLTCHRFEFVRNAVEQPGAVGDTRLPKEVADEMMCKLKFKKTRFMWMDWNLVDGSEIDKSKREDSSLELDVLLSRAHVIKQHLQHTGHGMKRSYWGQSLQEAVKVMTGAEEGHAGGHEHEEAATGQTHVKPLILRWDPSGWRAVIVMNMYSNGEADPLVLLVSRAGRKLKLESTIPADPLLEPNRSPIADVVWSTSGIFLFLITVDARIFLLSRDGQPVQIVCQRHPAVHPSARNRMESCNALMEGTAMNMHSHWGTMAKNHRRDLQGTYILDLSSSLKSSHFWGLHLAAMIYSDQQDVCLSLCAHSNLPYICITDGFQLMVVKLSESSTETILSGILEESAFLEKMYAHDASLSALSFFLSFPRSHLRAGDFMQMRKCIRLLGSNLKNSSESLDEECLSHARKLLFSSIDLVLHSLRVCKQVLPGANVSQSCRVESSKVLVDCDAELSETREMPPVSSSAANYLHSIAIPPSDEDTETHDSNTESPVLLLKPDADIGTDGASSISLIGRDSKRMQHTPAGQARVALFEQLLLVHKFREAMIMLVLLGKFCVIGADKQVALWLRLAASVHRFLEEEEQAQEQESPEDRHVLRSICVVAMAKSSRMGEEDLTVEAGGGQTVDQVTPSINHAGKRIARGPGAKMKKSSSSDAQTSCLERMLSPARRKNRFSSRRGGDSSNMRSNSEPPRRGVLGGNEFSSRGHELKSLTPQVSRYSAAGGYLGHEEQEFRSRSIEVSRVYRSRRSQDAQGWPTEPSETSGWDESAESPQAGSSPSHQDTGSPSRQTSRLSEVSECGVSSEKTSIASRRPLFSFDTESGLLVGRASELLDESLEEHRTPEKSMSTPVYDSPWT